MTEVWRAGADQLGVHGSMHRMAKRAALLTVKGTSARSICRRSRYAWHATREAAGCLHRVLHQQVR